MGWNTAALFIESPRQVVLEVIASHCKPTARELHFTEASLGKLAPELAIAEIDGWTELWDPGLELSFLPEQEPLRQLARATTATAYTRRSWPRPAGDSTS
jgi:hypothetical protein